MFVFPLLIFLNFFEQEQFLYGSASYSKLKYYLGMFGLSHESLIFVALTNSKNLKTTMS